MASAAGGIMPPAAASEVADGFTAAQAVVDDLTTASEVVDRPTLKSFAHAAKAYFESLTTMEESARVRGMLQDEDGPWRSDDNRMYLVRMIPDGTVLTHGTDPTADSKNLFDLKDDLGRPIVQELLAAAKGGGGFVTYRWDGVDHVAYAIETVTVVPRKPLVLFAGFSPDLSSVPVDLTPLPRPEVTAVDVVDRETLAAFTEAARREYQKAMSRSGLSELANVKNNFRRKWGDWNWDDVYIFAISTDAYTIFHGAQPARLEGRLFDDIDRQDINGVPYLRELLAAGQNGGGFVEYMFDNPAIEGDEDAGSLKIAYATGFTVQGTDDQWVIVVSGFYPDT